MESYRSFNKRDDKFKPYYPESSSSRTSFIPQASRRDQNFRSLNKEDSSRESRQDYLPEDRVQRNTSTYYRGGNFQRREGYESDNRGSYNSQSSQNFAPGIKRNYPFQETYDRDHRSGQFNQNEYSSLSKYDSFNRGRSNTDNQLMQDYDTRRCQSNDFQSSTREAFPSRYEYDNRQDKWSQSRQTHSSNEQDYPSASSGSSFNRHNWQENCSQSKVEFGTSKELGSLFERKRDYSRRDDNYQSGPELRLPENYDYQSQQNLRFQGVQDSSLQNKLELSSSKGQEIIYERRENFGRHSGNSQSGPDRGLAQSYGYQSDQDFRSGCLQDRRPQTELDFGSSNVQDIIYERRQQRDGNSQSVPDRGLPQNYSYQSRNDLGLPDMKTGYDNVSRRDAYESKDKQDLVNIPPGLDPKPAQIPSLNIADSEPAAKRLKEDLKSEEQTTTKLENYCKTCELPCITVEDYKAHMASADHKEARKERKKAQAADSKKELRVGDFYCVLCEKYLKNCSNGTYFMHCQGFKHKRQLRLAGKRIPGKDRYDSVLEETPPVGEDYLVKIEGKTDDVSMVRCTLCVCEMPEKVGVLHCKGKQHKIMYYMSLERNYRRRAPNPQDSFAAAILKADIDKTKDCKENNQTGGSSTQTQYPEFNSKYRLRGENLVCPLCVILLKTDLEYIAHIKGEEHRKVLMATKQTGMPIPNCSLLLALKNAPPIGLEYVQQIDGSSVPETTNEDDLQFKCTLCNQQFPGKSKIDHCKFNSHRCAYSKLRVQKMEQLEKQTNKNTSDPSPDDSSCKELIKNDGNAIKALKENDKNTANEDDSQKIDKSLGNASSEEMLKKNEEEVNKANNSSCEQTPKSNVPVSEETPNNSNNNEANVTCEEIKDDCKDPAIKLSQEHISTGKLQECETKCTTAETPSESDLLKQRKLIEDKERILKIGDLCCPLCKLYVRSEFTYQTHVKGRNHKKLKNEYKKRGMPVPDCSLSAVKPLAYQRAIPVGEEYLQSNEGSADVKIPTFSCSLCNNHCLNSHDIAIHCKSKKHRCFYATKLREMKEKIDRLLKKDARKLYEEFNRSVPFTKVAGEKNENDPSNEEDRIMDLNDPTNEADANNDQNNPSMEADIDENNKECSSLTYPEKPLIQIPRNIRCDICDVVCPDEFSYSTHIRGGRHREELAYQRIYHNRRFSKQEIRAAKKEAAKRIIPVGEEYVQLIPTERVSATGKPLSSLAYCKICDCQFDVKAKMSHLKGGRHRKAYKEKVDPDFLLVDMHERKIPWREFLKTKREENNRKKLEEASSSKT